MDIMDIVRENLKSIVCTKTEYKITLDCVQANIVGDYVSMDGIYDDMASLLDEKRAIELYNVAVGA